RQNADERTERIKAEQEKDRAQKKLQEYKQKKEETKLSERQKQAKEYQEQKQKEANSVKFKMITDNELPKLFYKNNDGNKKYSYLWGVELVETPEGYSVFFPILTDEKQTKQVKLKEGSLNFKDFFKESIGIVAQLNRGKFDTNFQKDKDGNVYLVKEDKEGGGVSLQEVKKMQDRISELENHLSGYANELKKAKEREEKYQAHIQDIEIEKVGADTRAEEFSKGWMNAKRKEAEFAKLAVDATAHLQDKEIGHTLAERLNWKFQEGLLERERMLSNEMARTSSETERKKIQENYADMMRSFERLKDVETTKGGG
ncbi:MAG: hypothetical protein ACOC80_17015, partial [Petrotogales bacterium]